MPDQATIDVAEPTDGRKRMDPNPSALWTLVLAAIGAGGSMIAAATGAMVWWSGIRKGRREAVDMELSRWSLMARPHSAGIIDAKVLYNLTKGPDIKLRALRAVSPRGLRFCAFHHETSPPGAAVLVIDEQRYRNINYNRNSSRGTFSNEQFQAFLEVPPKPFWSRSPRTRLRVEVSFEDRSARRRQTKIVVTSEEIPWTATSAAKIT